MRILLALATLAAAFGQGSGSVLMLTIRPQCGILESSYTHQPGTAEGLLRFRYVARAGAKGGKLYINVGAVSGAVQAQAVLDEPVRPSGARSAAGNADVLLAEITPHGRTQKEGQIGEVRLLWPNAVSAGASPRLIMSCD